MRPAFLPVVLVGLMAVSPLATAWGHTFHTGETLAKISETYYGHKSYQLVLVKLNQIKDPKKIPDGTVVRTPDLKVMLLSEGFPKTLDNELTLVTKARYSFIRVHEELTRALHPGNSTGKIQVPATIAKELRADADDLDKAGKVMAKQGNFSESATRMRQRLGSAAAILRKLAGGDNGKDLEDQAHLFFAQAFVRGLMWARNEDGDIKSVADP